MSQLPVTTRTLDREGCLPFQSYLLPATAQAMLQRREAGYTAVGAVSGRYSVGIAVLHTEGTAARITDLFVDETVRNRGVGSRLLRALLETVPPEIETVTAYYTLSPPLLDYMDALLEDAGFSSPETRAKAYTTRAHSYKGDRLLGRAMDPAYRTPKDVFPFSALSPEAMEELRNAPDIPDLLAWDTYANRVDPDLSVALVKDGRVAAYLLCGEGGEDGFILHAALRREGAPATAFLSLLLDMGNRCYYQKGGDFPLYFSAINDTSNGLAERIMGDRCVAFEGHFCSLTRE